MEKVVSPDGTILLTTQMSIMSTNAINGGGIANQKLKKEHTPSKDNTITNLKEWAEWGDADDFPLKLKETIGKIGVLGAGIDLNASSHYGNGVIWGKYKYENNKKVFVPENCSIWNNLNRQCEIDLQMSDLIDSLETFYIAFPEIILDNEKKKVYSVSILDPCFTRFERKDSTGKVSNVFFSTKFGESPTDEDITTIPIYDPAEPRKHQKFVFPVSYRSWGSYYYPEPIYYACIRNGYADVAIAVPKMLKAIFENQMTIKYIIRVPLEAMRRKYSMWDSPPDCDTPEKTMQWQLDKMQELQTSINDHLTKPENAFKGLYTLSEGEDKGIEIEPIKSYLDSSSELPTAAAANSELLFALQVDPALVGLGIPGGKNLSGSGSDKRESRAIKQASLKRERLVSLRLANLIAFLSELPPDLVPTYLDTDTSQTMDQNPTGKQNVVQA